MNNKFSLFLSSMFVVLLSGCTLINDANNSHSSHDEDSFDSETKDTETSETEQPTETETETTESTESTSETRTNLDFGEEMQISKNFYDKWYYWNDQDWCGSVVFPHERYLVEETKAVHVEFEVTKGQCDFGFQLFYKNSSLVMGNEYTLSFDIYTEASYQIGFNHQDYITTTPGNNHIELDYIEINEQASFAVAFKVYNEEYYSATIKNYSWELINEGNDDNPTDEIIYPNGYSTLYWHDEFNGNTLDTNNWGFDIGTGYNGWGNSEIQYYTDKNHKVADKVLTITAKKESMGGKQHTSSRIISKNKVHHTYGYIEARIALPLGTGMWPAFWMMPNDDYYGGWPRSGEIDIMEAKGRLPYISSSALHYTIKESNDHTYSTHEYNHETPINKYHVYAVKWEEDNIYFYVDGNLNYQANKSTWQTYSDLGNDKAPFDKDFYIILNLALGGQFDDYQNPSDSDLPAEMKIDYVRWFTK